MSYIVSCIINDHNPWMVLAAAVISALGSAVTVRLLLRANQDETRQRLAWLFLTGVAAGGVIWCTHFVAMLGYEFGATARIKPVLTGVSFFLAIIGAGAGFGLATWRGTRHAPELGGALVGITIAAMHYIGAEAVELRAEISWNTEYVAASIAVAALLCAASCRVALRSGHPMRARIAAGLLALGIVSLHFIGMAAMVVAPFAPATVGLDGEEMTALAISTAGVGLLIAGMGVTSHLLDVSLRQSSNDELRKMSLHDPLTTLPNRACFAEHVRSRIKTARRASQRFALVSVDINRFKEINEVFGHAEGDETLIRFANDLSSATRDGDFIARLGGDEFAIAACIENDEALSQLMARISRAAAGHISVGGLELPVTASFGVALFPDDGDTTEGIIKAADLAMQRAKTDPTCNVSFYEPGLDEVAKRRRLLAIDLRRALESGELTLHYQIQKDLRDDRTIGYETLLRWTHPIHGSISPAEFIPLAEETGLIIQIGEWVLRRACADAASWPEDCKVAVNISAVQFSDSELASIIEDALWKAGMSASQLEIEITETVLMADMAKTIRTLREIQALGVQVAMDDFGTGYSSLANLQAFSFDKIKLDRAFIWELEQSDQAKAIIRAVLALGRSLGVPILAEGVETAGQRDFLRAEGCFEVQGFFFGRPGPLAEVLGGGADAPGHALTA